jgi:DNA polymerase-3 subunit beta
MGFFIQKKALFDLIQKAYPIAPLKSSLQILSNLKIVFRENRLEIIATDLDHSISVTDEVENGEGEFTLAVNSRKLFDIVREFPDGTITVNLDENVLVMNSEKGFSCKIAGTDTKDFPDFPQIDTAQTFDISADMLRHMINCSSFAISKESSRTCLCGMLWEIEKERTSMVATDGHRLGKSIFSGNFSVDSKIEGIVPPKSLTHFIRFFSSDDEEKEKMVRVALSEKYVTLSADSFKICSKLYDGPYPDYEKAIPKSNTKIVFVEKSQLSEAVRRVSVLSNQKTHLVKFTFSKGNLEIVVLNRDIGGEAREVIPVEYDGERHAIGFNALFFNEILNIIEEKKVRIEMNTQISACLIFPVYENDENKKSDDIFLIMPLRIIEEME